MARILFIHADGREEAIEAAAGTTLMHAATSAGVDGIVAECGGAAMCATCHVYVENGEGDRLPRMSEVEHEMLESTASERRQASRLSCQITITDSLDGLVVHLPERQV